MGFPSQSLKVLCRWLSLRLIMGLRVIFEYFSYPILLKFVERRRDLPVRSPRLFGLVWLLGLSGLSGVFRHILVGVHDVLNGLSGLLLDVELALDSPWHFMELIHIHDLDVVDELRLLVDIWGPSSLVHYDTSSARIVWRVSLLAHGDRVG